MDSSELNSLSAMYFSKFKTNGETIFEQCDRPFKHANKLSLVKMKITGAHGNGGEGKEQANETSLCESNSSVLSASINIEDCTTFNKSRNVFPSNIDATELLKSRLVVPVRCGNTVDESLLSSDSQNGRLQLLNFTRQAETTLPLKSHVINHSDIFRQFTRLKRNSWNVIPSGSSDNRVEDTPPVTRRRRNLTHENVITPPSAFVDRRDAIANSNDRLLEASKNGSQLVLPRENCRDEDLLDTVTCQDDQSTGRLESSQDSTPFLAPIPVSIRGSRLSFGMASSIDLPVVASQQPEPRQCNPLPTVPCCSRDKTPIRVIREGRTGRCLVRGSVQEDRLRQKLRCTAMSTPAKTNISLLDISFLSSIGDCSNDSLNLHGVEDIEEALQHSRPATEERHIFSTSSSRSRRRNTLQDETGNLPASSNKRPMMAPISSRVSIAKRANAVAVVSGGTLQLLEDARQSCTPVARSISSDGQTLAAHRSSRTKRMWRDLSPLSEESDSLDQTVTIKRSSVLSSEFEDGLPVVDSFSSDSTDETLSCEDSLNTHVRTRSQFVCATCGEAFASKTILAKHLATHSGQKFACPFCNLTFSEKETLTTHKRLHAPDNPFACPSCSKAFGDEDSFKMHRRIHTEKKPFLCDVCNEAFTRKHNLKIHHQRFHSGERPFACSFCDKAFADKGNLKTHEKLHIEDKMLFCSSCSRSFVDETSLRMHERMHTEEKPFVCAICSDEFTRKYNLEIHIMRFHTGEKLFVCPFCNKVFTDICDLRVHKKKHTRRKSQALR